MFRRVALSSTVGVAAPRPQLLAAQQRAFSSNGAPALSGVTLLRRRAGITMHGTGAASGLFVASWGQASVRHFINPIKPKQQQQKAQPAGGGGAQEQDPYSANLYTRLGVPKTASESEIKHAFQTMAKRYHPDRNPDERESAQEKFIHVKEAKEILGNETKRKIYDETGSSKDAGDPKVYRTKKAIRTWVPLLFVGICAVGFLINSKILRPAKNSSNLFVRYAFNYISIVLVLLLLPNKLIASAFLTWSHARFYRQDMMADVSDHVIFLVDKPSFTKTPSKNSGTTVPIEVIPEDVEVKEHMDTMLLQVVSRDGKVTTKFNDLPTTQKIIKEKKTGEETTEIACGKFVVRVPVSEFYPDADEPAATKGQRYVRVQCKSGKNNSLELFDKKIPLPV